MLVQRPHVQQRCMKRCEQALPLGERCNCISKAITLTNELAILCTAQSVWTVQFLVGTKNCTVLVLATVTSLIIALGAAPVYVEEMRSLIFYGLLRILERTTIQAGHPPSCMGKVAHASCNC